MSKRTIKNLIIVLILVAVVATLGSLQRARKAEALAQDLAQPDEYEAYKAMKKLAALGAGAMGKVAPLLNSKDGHVRARAVMVIAATRARSYAPTLEVLLGDPDPEVRIAAAGGLGSLEDQGAVTQLTRLLTDQIQPMEVRMAAGRSLALLGSPQAVPALIAILQRPPTKDNAVLRQTAVLVLGASHAPEAVTALALHLQASLEPDAEVRALAART